MRCTAENDGAIIFNAIGHMAEYMHGTMNRDGENVRMAETESEKESNDVRQPVLYPDSVDHRGSET